jgi:glycerol-3-phosphate acyltransferase PlsY
MASAAFVLLAYLIGSLSFAMIVSRVLGLPDPHTYGSGNPGATNVLRSGSKLAALLTLIGDAGKGWLAVFLALRFAPEYGVAPIGVGACAVAVFLGHLFPVFHRFQGGKGVSTALGILLGIDLWLGLATLATWIIIAAFFRYASLASIIAAVFAPFYLYFLSLVLPQRAAWFLTMLPAVLLISALLVWRHKINILNLTAGRERKIGEKAHDRASGDPDPRDAQQGPKTS